MSKNLRLNELHKSLRAHERRRNEVKAEILQLNTESRSLSDLIAKEQNQIKILENELPHVTDHAVYRYMQRVLGLEMHELRKKILTPTLTSLMEKMAWADGTYPTGDGYQVVVKEGTIVTIIN